MSPDKEWLGSYKINYFIDASPSVGNLGITGNLLRESKFEVMLQEPINFSGTKWDGKVDVLYSTAKNPSSQVLNAAVSYPSSAITMLIR